MNLSDYSSCHLCPRVLRYRPPGFFWFLWLWRYHKSRQSRSALLGRALYQRHSRQRNDLFLRLYLKMRFCQNYPHQSAGIRKELTIPQLGDVFLSLQDQGAHNIKSGYCYPVPALVNTCPGSGKTQACDPGCL